MQTIALEIPEEILFDLKIPKERWKPELRKELALQLYRERLLSFGNARRLAGLTKLEFHYLLGDRKIARHYDLEEYRKDLENLEKWEHEQ
jgi:predicted HTH domain antitoxin